MLREVPGPTFQRAGKVASRYRLFDVQLVSCSGERAKTLEQLPDNMNLDVVLSDKTSWQLSEDKSTLLCRAAMKVETFLKGMTTPDGRAFAVESEFELSYARGPEDALETADFEAFASLNALHNAWPYMREFAQTTTLRMGFPGLVLEPLLIVPTRPPEAAAKKATEAK